MHAASLKLSGLRVLVFVDQVLVDTQIHQRMNLRFLPSLAEGRQILSRVAIEHQLVMHSLIGLVGVEFAQGELVLRGGLRESLT